MIGHERCTDMTPSQASTDMIACETPTYMIAYITPTDMIASEASTVVHQIAGRCEIAGHLKI
jgi:hypothetical protein